MVGSNRADEARDATRWCILCTSASKTLALAASLAGARLEVWTPKRTVKREAPGNRRRLALGQRKVMIEVDAPIIPGFVFARAPQRGELLRISAMPFSPHPGFTVLQLGGRVPLVGDGQVEGLRAAEAEALAAIAAERDEDRRKAERRARAERLGTERAKRKALRQESKALARGEQVMVDDVPALAGMVGHILEGRGTSAVVHFGGSLTMTVEAWRVRPVDVQTGNTLQRDAA